MFFRPRRRLLQELQHGAVQDHGEEPARRLRRRCRSHRLAQPPSERCGRRRPARRTRARSAAVAEVRRRRQAQTAAPRSKAHPRGLPCLRHQYARSEHAPPREPPCRRTARRSLPRPARRVSLHRCTRPRRTKRGLAEARHSADQRLQRGLRRLPPHGLRHGRRLAERHEAIPALRPRFLLHGRRRRQHRDRRALRRRSSRDLEGQRRRTQERLGQHRRARPSADARQRNRAHRPHAGIHRPREEARRRGHPVLRHLLFVPRRHVPLRRRHPALERRRRRTRARHGCARPLGRRRAGRLPLHHGRGALLQDDRRHDERCGASAWRGALRLRPPSLECRRHGEDRTQDRHARHRELRRAARRARLHPRLRGHGGDRLQCRIRQRALQGIRRDCRSAEERQDPRHRQHGRLQQPARRLRARHHRHR